MSAINDFKAGDLLVITSRNSRGEEKRTAQVTCVNYNGNGLVTIEGCSHSEHLKLQQTGAGAFDPAKIGTTPFGFYMAVEKVGFRTPWSPPSMAAQP